jgi:hypothetical protein
MCDRSAAFKESYCFHRVGYVGAAFGAQGLRGGSVVLATYERETALMLCDPGHLFPARILVAEIGNPAGIGHKRVDDVRMLAAVFEMKDTAALVFPEAELGFVVTKEDTDDLGGIRGIGRRIHMNMMDRS